MLGDRSWNAACRMWLVGMAVNSLRQLYSSSNGDRWEAGRDELGRLVIIHTPNVSSGGKPKLMDIGAFLAADHYGPEHESARFDNPAETPVLNSAGTIFSQTRVTRTRRPRRPGTSHTDDSLTGLGFAPRPFSLLLVCRRLGVPWAPRRTGRCKWPY